MRVKYKIIILIITFVILLLMGIAYAILEQDLKIEGKVSLEKPEEGYIVTYNIDTKWSNENKYYYKITMNLLNNTSKTLNGWKIKINAPYNCEIISYAGVNCKLNNNIIEFTNLSYNEQVLPKESVSFEFQLSTTEPNYNINDIIVSEDSNESENPDLPPDVEKTATVEVKQDNMWQADSYYYHQCTATVKNTGNYEINSWKFDLKIEEGSIEGIWNANYTQNENLFTFEPTSYNKTIPVGGEVGFGLIIKTTSMEIDLIATNIIVK